MDLSSLSELATVSSVFPVTVFLVTVFLVTVKEVETDLF